MSAWQQWAESMLTWDSLVAAGKVALTIAAVGLAGVGLVDWIRRG